MLRHLHGFATGFRFISNSPCAVDASALIFPFFHSLMICRESTLLKDVEGAKKRLRMPQQRC